MHLLEARKYILQSISQFPDNKALTEEDQDFIVDNLLLEWLIPGQALKSSNNINAFLPGKYVIPAQDLKLLESVFGVLTSAASTSYFLEILKFDPTKGIAPAITGIVVSILKLSTNLKLSAHLGPLEYAILRIISKNNLQGLTASEILVRLSDGFPDASLEHVSDSLQSMTAYPTIGGTKAVLTWATADNRWHTNV